MKYLSLLSFLALFMPVMGLADDIHDCATVRGLAVASNVLTRGERSRVMDVNGWLAKFEANGERQQALSRGIEDMARLMTTESGRTALPLIKRTLDSAPRGGYGDVYYWHDQVSAQYRVYSQVFAALNDLRSQLCQ